VISRLAAGQLVGERGQHGDFAGVGIVEVTAKRLADEIVDFAANSAFFAHRMFSQEEANLPVLRWQNQESAHRSLSSPRVKRRMVAATFPELNCEFLASPNACSDCHRGRAIGRCLMGGEVRRRRT
jgi:hypothetical protein